VVTVDPVVLVGTPDSERMVAEVVVARTPVTQGQEGQVDLEDRLVPMETTHQFGYSHEEDRRAKQSRSPSFLPRPMCAISNSDRQP
jgi:hypothetical protein